MLRILADHNVEGAPLGIDPSLLGARMGRCLGVAGLPIHGVFSKASVAARRVFSSLSNSAKSAIAILASKPVFAWSDGEAGRLSISLRMPTQTPPIKRLDAQKPTTTSRDEKLSALGDGPSRKRITPANASVNRRTPNGTTAPIQERPLVAASVNDHRNQHGGKGHAKQHKQWDGNSSGHGKCQRTGHRHGRGNQRTLRRDRIESEAESRAECVVATHRPKGCLDPLAWCWLPPLFRDRDFHGPSNSLPIAASWSAVGNPSTR